MRSVTRTRLAASSLALLAGAGYLTAQSTLPAVVAPAENPFTNEKFILGKALFWDEQLSSTNTMSCGTCHQPSAAGADPIAALNPGADGVFGTPDDVLGSFGVRTLDADDNLQDDPVFGTGVQTTGRAANPVFNTAFASELFWDGRAGDAFTDPQTGEVVIVTGGALESQAVGPVLSSVEMAHAGRDWEQVVRKLQRSAPLALAVDLPPDVESGVVGVAGYPELFERAFGDTEITASRIGMAIATYERSLISDQSPWDRFIQGDNGALTPNQIAGWNALQNSECLQCHTPPLFTNNDFHNLGLRPNNQDLGRGEVTGVNADNGKFKTPSLRNLSLRSTFMHTGQFTNLNQVVGFYAGPGAPGVPNRDPILPSPIPPPQVNNVVDFLVNGLLDERLANEAFPFDKPTLYTERQGVAPTVLTGGTAGSLGVPQIIADGAPNLGNRAFAVSLTGAPAGAEAQLVMSSIAPAAGVVSPDFTVAQEIVAPDNCATAHWSIRPNATLDGTTVYAQWRVDDPGAAGGVALSAPIELTYFSRVAPPAFNGDVNDDGAVGLADLLEILAAFGEPAAPGAFIDLDASGAVDLADLLETLSVFGASHNAG